MAFGADELPTLADEAPETYVAPRTDETDLWLWVIVQAIKDAFFASEFQLRASDGKGCDVALIRGDARRFLTMSWGPWAESREIIAAAASIDAELLAQACRVKLRQVKEAETTAEVVTLDTELARLIDLEDSLGASSLNEMLEKLASLEVAA